MNRGDILKKIEQIKSSKKHYADGLVEFDKGIEWHQECIRQCCNAQMEILAWQFALNFCEDD